MVGSSITNSVPISAFMAVAIMEMYETNPIDLCLVATRAIQDRTARDPDERRATRVAELASFVPQWILSVAVNVEGRDRDR